MNLRKLCGLKSIAIQEKFICIFRLAFPCKSGFKETKDIKIYVEAFSKREAKKKAENFIRDKIMIVFVEFKEV